MTFFRPAHRVQRMLCIGCLCLVAIPLIGCGKKEETQAPGYYNGPLQKKDPSITPGGATGGGNAPARGKTSTD